VAAFDEVAEAPDRIAYRCGYARQSRGAVADLSAATASHAATAAGTLAATAAGATIAAAGAREPAPAAKPRGGRKPAPKRLVGGLALAALLIAIAAIPFGLLRIGYYDLIVDVRGPLDFVETVAPTGSAPSFTPAFTTIAVRRAKWASWFEGWWLKDPPPAVPTIADAWLTAGAGTADNSAISFAVTPNPRAFPSGTAQLQTTVAFRNAISGLSTEPRSATLRRAPGKLLVDQPGGAIFRGQQGGAFAPPQVTFNLAAQGLGFPWSIEGTLPAWLEVAPARGELRDNQSVQAVAKLRPAAQALAPGTYEGQVAFKNMRSGEVTQRIARVVVDPRPAPPPGKLVIDVPRPLVFTGPQGGPFAPPSLAFKLKAVGPGLKWSAEGAPTWLELAPLQGEIRDNASVDLVTKPHPSAQTLPHGTYEAQLVFRKVGPGDTLTRPVRLVVEPPTGTLKLDAASALVFTGPQGGPFAPQRIGLNLKAVGPGLKWKAEGTPAWLELTPAEGEIRENASAEVSLKPRASAQALTPGTYEGKIAFKKTGPGTPIVQTVRLVVSISFR
jgi:Viral BACON domain